MNIDDVYNHFNKNWAEVSRQLKISYNTYRNWRKLGYIPMATQHRIEGLTQGKLLADSTLSKKKAKKQKRSSKGESAEKRTNEASD